jgi:hypothetical protein
MGTEPRQFQNVHNRPPATNRIESDTNATRRHAIEAVPLLTVN